MIQHFHLPFSFFPPLTPPPQFPKNNSRMPSVNIIEVWLPGPLHSLYFKILRSNEQAGPAFKPICLSEWSRGSGPLAGALSPPALGHGTEMGPQDSGRRGPVTAQPVWACSLQRGGCGKSPVTWSVVVVSRSGGLVLQLARREDRATPGTEHGEQSQRDFSVFCPPGHLFFEHWQRFLFLAFNGDARSVWSKPTSASPCIVLFFALWIAANILTVSL